MKSKILELTEKIERVMIIILLVSLLAVVLYSIIVFLGLLFGAILRDIGSAFDAENNIMEHLHEVFSGFLSVLIGIELVHTIKVYLKDNVVHVEVVILVALIGISRHIIDIDYAHLEPLTLVGIAALVISLASSYFLIKKGMRVKRDEKQTEM